MYKSISICLCFSLVVASADVSFARGGRAIGGGGFSGGGMRSMPSRPSPSFNRSPSMSRSMPRPSPSINRPSPSINRPSSSYSRPSISGSNLNRSGSTLNRSGSSLQNRLPSGGSTIRPSISSGQIRSNSGSSRIGSGSSSNLGSIQSQRSYQRPSSNQLNSFLNLPSGQSGRTGISSTTPKTGTKTFETKRGNTVTVGRGAGSGTTDGGVKVGGAGRGVVVEGKNGQTYARGKGTIGASDGTNKAFASGSRTGVRTASGEAAVVGRGIRGATDGQNSVIRGGVGGVAQDRYGNTRAGFAGGTAATDGRNTYTSRGSVRAIRDPAGNVVATGRAMETYNGALISNRQVVAVRNGFTGYGRYYTPGWYARYPGAWFAAGVIANSWWNGAYWNSAAGYCDCATEPMSYDYGESIVYEDGMVYAGEQAIATEEQYAEQASDIADAGAIESENEDWLPLGVFAVVTDEQTSSDKILQLAVNKEGVIRGNLHDKLTDQVIPVVGSVDKDSQRAAFRPENKEFPVAECGLYNLTQNALKTLVHFGEGKTEQRSLIRLEQPEEE